MLAFLNESPRQSVEIELLTEQAVQFQIHSSVIFVVRNVSFIITMKILKTIVFPSKVIGSPMLWLPACARARHCIVVLFPIGNNTTIKLYNASPARRPATIKADFHSVQNVARSIFCDRFLLKYVQSTTAEWKSAFTLGCLW